MDWKSGRATSGAWYGKRIPDPARRWSRLSPARFFDHPHWPRACNRLKFQEFSVEWLATLGNWTSVGFSDNFPWHFLTICPRLKSAGTFCWTESTPLFQVAEIMMAALTNKQFWSKKLCTALWCQTQLLRVMFCKQVVSFIRDTIQERFSSVPLSSLINLFSPKHCDGSV